jgi:hypothetical protein
VLWDLVVRLVHPGLLDLQVALDHQDKRGDQVPLEVLDPPVKVDQQVAPDLRDKVVLLDPLDLQDKAVLLDPLDLADNRGLLVLLAVLDLLDKQAEQDHLGHQVLPDKPVEQVLQVLQEQELFQALLTMWQNLLTLLL